MWRRRWQLVAGTTLNPISWRSLNDSRRPFHWRRSALLHRRHQLLRSATTSSVSHRQGRRSIWDRGDTSHNIWTGGTLSPMIFSTRSQEVVDGCKQIFSCQTPSDAVADRKCKFLKKFFVSDNMLCQVFKDVAMDELALLPSSAYQAY